MKYTFTRFNQQWLLSVVALTSIIMPVTSAVAILPMTSEVFEVPLPVASSIGKTTSTLEDTLSKENLSEIEGNQVKAFSKTSKFSTLVRESKQFMGIEKRITNVL